MTGPVADAFSQRRVHFPEDRGLADLPKLFDTEWVWERYRRQFGTQVPAPKRLRLGLVSQSIGKRALVSYTVEWSPDDYLPPEHVTLRVERDSPIELYRYPDDPYLPGLQMAADPESAHQLVSRHVLAFPGRRLRVERIRYRPGSRAVLRHRVGRVKLYARVMRPTAVPVYFKAGELADQSGFVLPRVAGHWEEGATIWLSEIPGRNMRRQIRKGHTPDPTLLLEGLERLWNTPPSTGVRPFNLPGLYHRAKRSIRNALKGERQTLETLAQSTRQLDAFIKTWRPSTVAHNDFYDDQMLVLPDGRIALVDFEETGAGDPLLDIGNFLAHLKWMFLFKRRGESDASGTYHTTLREATLERFSWTPRDLDLREAVCLFRVCTNAIRRPKPDWRERLEKGLRLVNTTLG